MKLELKNELGQVYYTGQFNTNEGWLHNEWIGYVAAEEVISAVKQLMSTFGVSYSKILNDSRKAEGSWDEANNWLAQNWIPQAIGGGLKKFAQIVSSDVFSAMSSEELATKIPEAGFEMFTFENISEAEAWLRTA